MCVSMLAGAMEWRVMLSGQIVILSMSRELSTSSSCPLKMFPSLFFERDREDFRPSTFHASRPSMSRRVENSKKKNWWIVVSWENVPGASSLAELSGSRVPNTLVRHDCRMCVGGLDGFCRSRTERAEVFSRTANKT